MADDITCRLNNSSVTRVYSAFLPALIVYIRVLTLSIKILTFKKISDNIFKRSLWGVFLYILRVGIVFLTLFRLRLFDGIQEDLACVSITYCFSSIFFYDTIIAT